MGMPDLQGCDGKWGESQPGQTSTWVEWNCTNSGLSVSGKVIIQGQGSEQPSQDFEMQVSEANPIYEKNVVFQEPAVTVELRLRLEDQVNFEVKPPGDESWILIGSWAHGNTPTPDPPGCIGDNDGEDGVILQPVPTDLFPFMCLRPTDAYALGKLPSGFIICEDRDSLPFYKDLQSLKKDPDAPSKMRAAATDFMKEDSFVANFAALPAPMPNLLIVNCNLLLIQGKTELDKLTEDVTNWIGEAPADFLKSDVYKTSYPKIWQSLFALPLVSNQQQGCLADELTTAVRVIHFLTQLTNGDVALEDEDGRLTILQATLAFPNGVAPGPLRAGTDVGWLTLLGLGELKLVQHHVQGYVNGEIAATITIMPHEEREEMDRSLQREEETETHREREDKTDRREQEYLTGSNLEQEIRELIGTTCASGDLSNVTPSYNNLNLVLSGTWSSDESTSERADNLAAQYAQQVSERAAHELSRKMLHRRSYMRVYETEKSVRRTFNNSSGTEPVNGFYHWLDKVVELNILDRGKRLVMEFMLPEPAKTFLEVVKYEDGLPLAQPQPLAAFAEKDGWKLITPCNYQQFGLQYGIDTLIPPPQDSIVISETISAQPPQTMTTITIPAGYQATKGSVSYILPDASYAMAGYVGSVSFSVEGQATKVDKPQILQSVKDCSNPTRQQAPPLQSPISGVKQISFAEPVMGSIQTAVLSSASSFMVTVELICIPNELGCVSQNDGTDSSLALELWQRETYSKLYDAYNECLLRYKLLLEARLARESLGHVGSIQRKQLAQAAYKVLQSIISPTEATSNDLPSYLRRFELAFDWDDSAYHYYPWAVGVTENPQSKWPSVCVLDPNRDVLFKAFINAASAKLTVAIMPGYERWILNFLLYGTQWIGRSESVPISEAYIPILYDLDQPREDNSTKNASSSWTVRVPTDLLVLGNLPNLSGHGG